MEGVATRPATYEKRLCVRILRGGPDAVDAAVALMERHEPASFEDALDLIPNRADLTPPCRQALTEAWDRYFHISGMSWD